MPRVRSRPSHALGNDVALRDSAIRLIAERGWDAVTMTSIAERVGLTHGAAYARFADKSDFAVHLWHGHLREVLLNACHELDAVIEERGVRGHDPGTHSTYEAFARPSTAIRAAVELLQAAAFEPTLRQDIWDDFAATLAEDPDSTQSVVRAATRILALGLLLTANRSWLESVDLSSEWTRYTRALRAPASPVTLPVVRSEFYSQRSFGTHDPRMETVLEAMTQEVAARGYHRATMSRVCRSAGAAPAYIYNRWPNKRALLLATGEALLEQGLHGNERFLHEVSETYGRGIAEAVTWRLHFSPELAVSRSIFLEVNRQGFFDGTVQDMIESRERLIVEAAARDQLSAYAHTEIAIGYGVSFLAQLAPKFAELPFDSVTIPLAENMPFVHVPERQ